MVRRRMTGESGLVRVCQPLDRTTAQDRPIVLRIVLIACLPTSVPNSQARSRGGVGTILQKLSGLDAGQWAVALSRHSAACLLA